MHSRSISRLLTLAALGAVVAVYAGTGLARPAQPHAVLTQASGDFTIANSLDGHAVFQASGLAPGRSVTGTVQLANSSALDGALNLAQLDVQDRPGANGGRLSGAVHLDIADVTGGSSIPVFSGQLASVGTRPLGPIGSGQARTFRFTASLPDTGQPPSSTGGDNAYAGSGLTAGYAWTATSDDVSGSGGDVAPVVKIRVVTKKLLKKGVLDVMTSCDKACRVSAYAQMPKARRGKKTAKSRARTALLTIPNKTARMRLKISRKSKRALVKMLRQKRRVVLRVNVTVSAAAGGPSRAYSRKVPVKQPKPKRRRR